MITPSTIAIYVHIPWCVKKCPYCDFNSHLKNETFDEARYVDALIDDFKTRPIRENTKLTSIFFGGGTPSLFAPSSFEKILDTIHARYSITDSTEITIEANPGTLDSDHFKGYREAGINRISIGVQSLRDEHLAYIGRIHDAKTGLSAIETAAAVGFKRINADIMYALPNQRMDELAQDTQTLLAMPIDHLSAYQLTIEPNTPFARRPPPLPDDDDAIAMQAMIIEAAAQKGFKRYEVSAFAKVGGQSEHNLNYWQFGDYIGIGAGAHGKLTRDHSIERSIAYRSPKKYMQGLESRRYREEKQIIKGDEIFIEYAMNQLRLIDGFNIAHAIDRSGIDGSRLFRIMKPLVDAGLIEQSQTTIRTTAHGYRLLDSVLVHVMENVEKTHEPG